MSTAQERGGTRRPLPPRKRRIEPAVFGIALQRLGRVGTKAKSYEAARLVMCEGKKMSEAVRISRVSRQAIYQAMDRIEGQFKTLGICHSCGQKLPPV